VGLCFMASTLLIDYSGMLLSDVIDRLLGEKNIKDYKLLFWIFYVLSMVILTHIFSLGWLISYWLSIPLAIVFPILIFKIFYKLVKPTRKF
jgi:hypothetical protein